MSSGLTWERWGGGRTSCFEMAIFKVMFPWILLEVVRVIAGMTFSGVALESCKIDHHRVK